MKLLSARLPQILLFSLVLCSISSSIVYSQFTEAALKGRITAEPTQKHEACTMQGSLRFIF